MAASKAVAPRLRVVRTSKRADKSFPASTRNFIERLPSEILIRILSYLDASALFSIGHINKHFYVLAKENALWKKLYMVQFGKKKKYKPTHELQLQMKAMQLQDEAAGHWKWLYFRMMATPAIEKSKRLPKLTSLHTGLPSQTERVLRDLCVTWELTVTDKPGRETTLDLSCSQFLETAVALCWSTGGFVPDDQQISTFRLHSVRRTGLNCPGLKTPGWRSLMAEVDVQTLSEGAQVVGRDKLVELKLLQPGIAIGVWKGEHSIAFIMFTLHFNMLVERSTQGSHFCPYAVPTVKHPFDDIDPEYGLHGYHLHLVLHNTRRELMSASFSQLFCRRSQISNGLIQLIAINRTNVSQHTRLSGSVTLPWRTETLQGTMEDCCIMSLTLLDEFKTPFKCVSSPVCMKPVRAPVSYDYDGEHYLIHHQDSDSRVEMQLVRMEAQQQLVLVSLVVYVSVCSVNKCFGCNH